MMSDRGVHIARVNARRLVVRQKQQLQNSGRERVPYRGCISPTHCQTALHS